MRKTPTKTLPAPRRRKAITLRDLARELDRICPKADGKPHNPDWIGRVRRGDAPSEKLLPEIERAARNLAKALS